MKQRIAKQIPYLFLGLVFLMLLFLNIGFQSHWLDSDMAAEMMFSKLLSESGHIFATPEWYYSTEFRFLYTQLIMAPLFHLTNQWQLIRTITNVVFYVLMMVSFFYCIKPLKVSAKWSVLAGSILLLPFSETMMTHMQMGNTYMSHVIIIYFFFGMFLRLVETETILGWRRLELCIWYVVLAVICGVSGVRYLLTLLCPLVLAAFLYVLQSEAFLTFRKEMNKEHFLAIWKCGQMRYFIYSLVGFLGTVVGYGMNVLWVSKQYVFQTYGETNFISIYQGVLFDRLQNAIGCLLMFFGYIPDKGVLSIRGVVTIAAFVILAILCFCGVKGYRRSQGKRRFVALFLGISMAVNCFVFVFTTSTMVPRYYIPIFMFAILMVAVFLEEESVLFDQVLVGSLLAVCILLGSAKTVLSFVTVDKNENKRAVAEYLAENGYHFGFATYTNGNIITELTDGEVEIGNIGDPQTLAYFKWSSPKKYYEEGYGQGEVFLLLTVQEAEEYAEAEAVCKGQETYRDDNYVVYLYDTVEQLMGYAQN